MNYKESTNTIKRRFSASNKCVFCNKPILESQDFGYNASRNGKSVKYMFFHSTCMKASEFKY